MARRTAAVIFTLGCLQASAVSALGLGELTLESFLNEPFKAKVDLLNTEGLNPHQIRIRLATLDDFDRMGVERAYFLTGITFEVKIDDAGHGQILMTSEDSVLEPYLDFIVEARWPTGRLLREYTVLVDPPVFDSNQTVAISAMQSVQVVEGGGSPDTKKSQAAVASSGTQVKVAKSDLAPGEMPQRNFGSDAELNPESGNRYLIRRDDTLWQIAQRAKPAETSVHQTMLDIQRLNPQAFIGGNINRIKAGYVIYLPASGDISSDDTASALAEVRQQNQDWRDGVSSDRGKTSGGSLRISTEPAENPAGSSAADSNSAAASATELASLEDLARSERDKDEVEDRLGAMAEQVDTLERIVSLKDDQIAALQSALAEANAKADGASSAAAMDVDTTEEVVEAEVSAPAPQETASVAVIEPPQEKKPVAVAPPEESGGFFGNIMYIVGLLLAIGVAVLVFMRRRGSDDEEETQASTTDVFANIQLGEQNIEVGAEPETGAAEEAASEEERDEPARSRGYGQRKNDEYADDGDSSDALAEADIYIAYGRLPQALDLLKTAVAAEPDNAAYKLKMMKVCTELGDEAEVMQQYADLKALGDADSLSAADAIVADLGGAIESVPVEDATENDVVDTLDLSDELDLPDLDLAGLDVDVSGSDIDELDFPDLDLSGVDDTAQLEDDFGSLEIEGFETESDDDELDLSADFDTGSSTGDELGGDDEDLVFAVDSDAMSTKLDLARAYLDMGDQDGARTIFEEVVAEGSDEQKEEARALLERLD